ncbi:MAG TPA: prepilin-type N-terminal cleavage/methylation domain-containing protein [Bacilli bacterium]
MNNEKGITVLELLTSLTILTILMGAGFMLLTSVNSLWDNSAQKRSDDSKINLTLNMISRELATPVEMYMPSANELRFKTFAGKYKSLVYTPASQTLTLKESTDATAIENGTYVARATLADTIAPDTANSVPAFAVKQSDGTAFPLLSKQVGDQRIVKIYINFKYNKRITVGSSKIIIYKNFASTITLFQL